MLASAVVPTLVANAFFSLRRLLAEPEPDVGSLSVRLTSARVANAGDPEALLQALGEPAAPAWAATITVSVPQSHFSWRNLLSGAEWIASAHGYRTQMQSLGDRAP